MSVPSVIMIGKESSHLKFRISQTQVFLDFVKPVLDKDRYFIMNRNSLLAEEPLKETKLRA